MPIHCFVNAWKERMNSFEKYQNWRLLNTKDISFIPGTCIYKCLLAFYIRKTKHWIEFGKNRRFHRVLMMNSCLNKIGYILNKRYNYYYVELCRADLVRKPFFYCWKHESIRDVDTVHEFNVMGGGGGAVKWCYRNLINLKVCIGCVSFLYNSSWGK